MLYQRSLDGVLLRCITNHEIHQGLMKCPLVYEELINPDLAPSVAQKVGILLATIITDCMEFEKRFRCANTMESS